MSYMSYVIGKTKEGVVSYKNDTNESYDKKKQNYVMHIYTGVRWECVEFVRRYLIFTKNVTFTEVKNAYEVYDGPIYFINLDSVLPIEVERFKNGEKMPKKGDILIFHVDNEQHGHICILSNVDTIKGEIEIVEQNYDNMSWKGNFYSRILKMDLNTQKIQSPDPHEHVYGLIRVSR